MTGGYMQGVTKKGIDLVSRVTGVLNQLTADDFEDTYVWLRVSLMEADSEREVGFWSNEYDYGNYAYFDGPRSNFTAPKQALPIKGRLQAFAKDCVAHGDMTPAAAQMLERILEEYAGKTNG